MRRKLKCKPFTSDFCFWGVVSDTTPHVIPNDVTPQQPLSCLYGAPIHFQFWCDEDLLRAGAMTAWPYIWHL